MATPNKSDNELDHIIKVLSRSNVIDILIRNGIINQYKDVDDVETSYLKEIIKPIIKENVDEYTFAYNATKKKRDEIKQRVNERQQLYKEAVASLHFGDIIPINIMFPITWRISKSVKENKNRNTPLFVQESRKNIIAAAKILQVNGNSITIQIADDLKIPININNNSENLDLTDLVLNLNNKNYDWYNTNLIEIIDKKDYSYKLHITFMFVVSSWIQDIHRREEVSNVLENYGITYPSHIISEYIT